MERSKLTELGLTDEQVDGAMKLFNSDIEPLKAELGTVKQENESLHNQVADRDSSIDELSKQAGNSQKLNKQIEDLQSEIKQHDDDAAAQLAETQMDNAIELSLRDANVRDSKAVIPFLDRDTIKLEDGRLKGIDEQIKAIKEEHDYLFDTADNGPAKPASHPTNPGDVTGGKADDVDISKMSYGEMLKLKQESPDVFKAAVETAENN